jgi:hypothetical protein
MIRTVCAAGAVLKMPLLRYFVFVGASLLALLFISDAYLPKLPVEDVTSAAADLPMIRIQSDRKWPERVVFDTRIPAINPAQTEAAVPASTTVADVSAKARVREAFAQLQPQLQPSEPKQLQPSVPKMPAPAVPRKRKIAKKHLAPPAVLVAQQQPFGFFTNNAWFANNGRFANNTR